MRLIDADALKEHIKQMSAYYSDNLPTQGMLSLIDQVPTISPESLRPEGRWVEKDFGEAYECSNCGWLTDFRLSCYCPNCGAKMEG